jgi:hypothetical protein
MMSAMSNSSANSNDDEFTPPGAVHVSAAALQFARNFNAVAKSKNRGEYVVSFDWAQSISTRSGPDKPLENMGACLMLGAYQRRDIPVHYIQTIDGMEFAIKIPADVWQNSTQRLIDIDVGQLFKLTLR